MTDNLNNCDGLVLLAKKPGLTSFSSLYSIKKALNTTKVGHTGTLDSFAQGLLVVCTGRLTKLAGCITEFNKTYEAVIHFGSETDTLEYTGNIIRTAPLPSIEKLTKTLENFKGKLLQAPPAFSALHINGKRASDLARAGKTVELPPRPITVFNSEIVETRLSDKDLVEYARINFTVSKGTYIRCLARDIAKACDSAGHLTGLYRTRIGDFDIKDAAGYKTLDKFTIESAIYEEKLHTNIREKKSDLNDTELQKEIRTCLRDFDQKTAELCGFIPLRLKNEQTESDFCNGKQLRSALFCDAPYKLPENSIFAVFSQKEKFKGLIELNQNNSLLYKFVIN